MAMPEGHVIGKVAHLGTFVKTRFFIYLFPSIENTENGDLNRPMFDPFPSSHLLVSQR